MKTRDSQPTELSRPPPAAWRSGLRLAQIGIGLVVLLVILIIGGNVQQAVDARIDTLSDADVRLRNAAQSAAAHANSAFWLADTTGATIGLQLEAYGMGSANLLRVQNSTMARLSDQVVLNNIVVMDAMGNGLLSARSANASNVSFADRDYFAFHQSNATRTPYIGKPVQARSNGNWIIPVSHRFDHADGSFAGVVAVSVEVTYFTGFYRSLELEPGERIGLYFDDRTVLGSNLDRGDEAANLDPALDLAELRGTKAGNTSARSAIGGAKRRYGHAHLKRYPLVAVTSYSLDRVLTGWRAMTWRLAFLALLGLMVLGLLGAILLFQVRSRQKAETVLLENALQFRSIIDRIDDYGIYMLDVHGNLTSWNAGAQRLTGFSSEEIIGRHSSTLYSPADVLAGHPERTLVIALRYGRDEDERWRLRKDGTRFLANVITTPLYNNAGQHYGFLKLGRDVTASRQLSDALKASEFRWKFALEGAGEGVWDWNEQTGAVDFSRPYMVMLGYDDNEIEGTFEGWKRLVHPDDLKGVYKAFSAHNEGRTPNYNHEYRIRCKDGSYKWVIARGMVVSRDALGRRLRTIGTQSDISQIKAAEKRLSEQNALILRTNAQLQQASKVKSEFLANMSHELRTPLNAVLGFTGTLLMELPGPLNDDQKKQLHTVRASGRHLLELINEILDLSKIESGVTDIIRQKVWCQQLINEVHAALTPLAVEKSIVLSLDLPPDAITICSDARLIKQILINLVGNAIKFTEAGSVTVRLHAPDGSREEPVTIDVIDTGIGIDAADLGKLFQPFTQLETSLSRRYQGTGLGLNLSKKYADLLGAKLSVHSNAGQGTVFSLQLPPSLVTT